MTMAFRVPSRPTAGMSSGTASLLATGSTGALAGALRRKCFAQFLDSRPDPADGGLPAAELLHRLNPGQAVPDLNQPVGGPIPGRLMGVSVLLKRPFLMRF